MLDDGSEFDDGEGDDDDGGLVDGDGELGVEEMETGVDTGEVVGGVLAEADAVQKVSFRSHFAKTLCLLVAFILMDWSLVSSILNQTSLAMILE